MPSSPSFPKKPPSLLRGQLTPGKAGLALMSPKLWPVRLHDSATAHASLEPKPRSLGAALGLPLPGSSPECSGSASQGSPLFGPEDREEGGVRLGLREAGGGVRGAILPASAQVSQGQGMGGGEQGVLQGQGSLH